MAGAEIPENSEWLKIFKPFSLSHFISTEKKTQQAMEDLSKIDISGVKVIPTSDGKGIDVTFDKSKVTERSFKEVLEYIYTDRVAWDKNTDPFLISEVKNSAQYLHLDRLAAICDTYLDKSKNVTVPESTWWKNMKWAFENLRVGKNSLSDFTIVVKDGEKTVDIPCHADDRGKSI